jgi:4-hydroxythreonine-4-phosphate dehydrogenase
VSDRRPLIALALGDPSGVGPELVVRVLAEPSLRARLRAVILGDPEVVRENARRARVTLPVRSVASVADLRDDPLGLDVLQPPGPPVGELAWGRVDAGSGGAALAALELAAELAVSGSVDGVLSAPLNKQALRLAGMRQADELALLAERTGCSDPLLVGVLGSLLTACVTLHVPLRDVPGLVTRARVLATITALAALVQRAGERPRILVAGLNPHAGDGGLLGREELDEIEPALRDARAGGLEIIGPVAPDTAFPQARAQAASAVVCMYHDQANIARKLTGLGGATLFAGLPVPVATTAHGTAFDLAGSARADPASMLIALEQLIRLAGTGGGAADD